MSASIIIIYSLILNWNDYRNDCRVLKTNELDDHTIIKNEFKDLEMLKGVGIFRFAARITVYSYPFLLIFSMYKYDQPRFIPFLIEMLNFLLSMTFSLLPYYKVPFSYEQMIKDRRDIEEEALDINNLPFKLYNSMVCGFYTMIGSIVVSILIAIFLKIIRHEKFIEKSWRERKKIIYKYVRVYMIKPLIL